MSEVYDLNPDKLIERIRGGGRRALTGDPNFPAARFAVDMQAVQALFARAANDAEKITVLEIALWCSEIITKHPGRLDHEALSWLRSRRFETDEGYARFLSNYLSFGWEGTEAFILGASDVDAYVRGIEPYLVPSNDSRCAGGILADSPGVLPKSGMVLTHHALREARLDVADLVREKSGTGLWIRIRAIYGLP